MHKSKAPPTRIENQLLAALSTESYNRLLPVLETVPFALGDILYKPRRAIEYVYFPYKTIISIVNILAGDAKVEMAIIGSEGMLGTALISGNDKSPHQAIVQIGDSGMRMEAQAFRKEFRRNSELHDLVLYYSQALFVQVTQTAACNTLHPIIERLSRWLLMTQDRMASDTFYLTHDFIATMLGVRRGGRHNRGCRATESKHYCVSPWAN